MIKQSLPILSLIVILFFFIFVQLQNPGQAMSGERTMETDNLTNAMSDESSGKAIIGQIRTKDKILIIRSGDDGFLYTVKSKDGGLLATDLKTEELGSKFPDLKDVVERGLAGDASLRMNNRLH